MSKLIILHEEGEDGNSMPDLQTPVQAVSKAVANLVRWELANISSSLSCRQFCIGYPPSSKKLNSQGWARHDQLLPRLEDEVGDAKVVGGHREGVRLPDGGQLQSQVRSVFPGESQNCGKEFQAHLTSESGWMKT